MMTSSLDVSNARFLADVIFYQQEITGLQPQRVPVISQSQKIKFRGNQHCISLLRSITSHDYNRLWMDCKINYVPENPKKLSNSRWTGKEVRT